MTTVKSCTTCSAELPLDQFHVRRATKDGRAGICRPCCREYDRSRYYADGSRRYTRTAYLRRKYGISTNEYDAMHKAQGGVCAICQLSSSGSRLAVDHCHSSGAVRGLLCFDCNSSLGKFRDDEALLARAIEYLQRSRRVAA